MGFYGMGSASYLMTDGYGFDHVDMGKSLGVKVHEQ